MWVLPWAGGENARAFRHFKARFSARNPGRLTRACASPVRAKAGRKPPCFREKDTGDPQSGGKPSHAAVAERIARAPESATNRPAPAPVRSPRRSAKTPDRRPRAAAPSSRRFWRRARRVPAPRPAGLAAARTRSGRACRSARPAARTANRIRTRRRKTKASPRPQPIRGRKISKIKKPPGFAATKSLPNATRCASMFT